MDRRPRTKSVGIRRLAHFCTVLESGVGEGQQDAVIIKLRDYLLNTPNVGHRNMGNAFDLSIAALDAWFKGKNPKVLSKLEEDPFPV